MEALPVEITRRLCPWLPTSGVVALSSTSHGAARFSRGWRVTHAAAHAGSSWRARRARATLRAAGYTDAELAEIDAPVDDYGYTRLFRAVESGLRDEAEALLVLGADANARMRYGRRFAPLHVAQAAEGSESLVRLLVAHGAVVDQRTIDDVTPLLIAAAARDFPTVKALVEAGADVNYLCNDDGEDAEFAGLTPLAATLAPRDGDEGPGDGYTAAYLRQFGGVVGEATEFFGGAVYDEEADGEGMANGNVYEHANELVRAIVGDEGDDVDGVAPAARADAAAELVEIAMAQPQLTLYLRATGAVDAAARCLAADVHGDEDDARAANDSVLLLCVLLNEVREQHGPVERLAMRAEIAEQCLGALLAILRSPVSSPRLQNAATCLKEIARSPELRARMIQEGSVVPLVAIAKAGSTLDAPRHLHNAANCAVATLQKLHSEGASFEAAVHAVNAR